jgi:hypothetical protein
LRLLPGPSPPQVSALPPLAIFHDLRWLYSTQRSWLWFGLLLAGLLVVRAALNTALVRLAWPTYLTPPPLAALRGALVVTTLACLLISPLVSLTFGWPYCPSPGRSSPCCPPCC